MKARTSKLPAAMVVATLFVGSLVFLSPFYVSLAMALKSPNELATTVMWAWPKKVTWVNFERVLHDPLVSFELLLRNTLLIAVVSTTGVVLSSSLAAYAFSRLRFRGRDRLFYVILATMMLPGIVTLIPSFVMFAKIHWVDSFLPLTVPAFFGGGAFNIFLLRQFFMTLPRELEEAAIIDGASHFQVYRRVIMPLSGPALAVVGLLTFIGTWRDFMGPLLYLDSPSKQTLEVGLSTFQSQHSVNWGLLMAGTVLVSLPLIAMFLIGQRYIVRGISLTGLKG